MDKGSAFLLLLISCTLLGASSVHSDVLIDPTRPPTSPEPTEQVIAPRSSWSLESTLVSPNRRVAVINGELVGEGEWVDGARVITIRKLAVLLQTNNRRVTLHLLPDIVKRKL